MFQISEHGVQSCPTLLHMLVKDKILSTNSRLDNLNELGLAYRYIGNGKESISFLEQGLDSARESKHRDWEGAFLGNLGSTYAMLGDIHKAIQYHEQALVIDREIGARKGEGANLGNLGNRYTEIGDAVQAIKFYEQELNIVRDINDRVGESMNLETTGHAYLSLNEFQKAKENYQQAIQIANEISLEPMKQYARWGLAQAYLFQNDLANAHATIEAALQYDVLQNNHNAAALHGIIALQQGERETAKEAFNQSIAQADEILVKTPEYYSALDAKGLALCGLAICDLPPSGTSRLTIGRREELLAEAVETFKKARKIAPHAGVVKSVLRLFDELVKCDEDGVLKGVRKAVEGVE
jgi:tetratricopeptide (TPR) repeat protein